MKKYIPCAIMTLLLILTAAICVFAETRMKPTESYGQTGIAFRIPAGDKEEIISWWSNDDGQAFVFLPSYAELKDLRVILRKGTRAMIGDMELSDGMDCGCFEPDTEYEMTVQNQSPMAVRFVRSGNLPTMFIHTVSGTEETIHTQRNVWEYAQLCLMDTEGKTDYQGELDEISGRGSGTWFFEKKSYNLKLNGSADLLGMGAGKKWALLANVIDESHLRNKLIYDFAREIGSYSGFAPNCEHVDVYLNGTYVGLYLLTEKAEIAENRVEADPEVILFEVDALGRSERMLLPFVLDWGTAVGIKSPESCTEQERDLLMNDIFAFQDTLLDESKGEEALQFIDLESWTRRYLIDEIFENYDGGCHSQYFFRDQRDGKDNRIIAGPCWDYDNCADGWFMAKQNPRCFLMQRMWKNEGEHTPWYGTLMKKETFRDRVLELYRNELSAKVRHLMEVQLPEEAAFLQKALKMNAIRWSLADPAEAIQHFHDFMEERIDFLDSAWIDGVEYRTVTAKSIWDYRYYCTQPGTICEDIPMPEELGVEEGSVWIREDTGELFDPKSVITEDFTIVSVPGETETGAA